MKKALIISVAINVIIILTFAGKRLYYSYKPDSGQSYADIVNTEKNTILKELPIHEGDKVFVGNSITERFPMNEMFNNICVKNRGISGNQTRHVLHRIGYVARAYPSKIFLEAGINDLGQKVPQKQIMINFASIIDSIKSYSPTTKIYIQSLLPTRGAAKYLMPEIIKLNEVLRDFCKSAGAIWVDVYSPFEVNGEMDASLTTDGTHLNYDGYTKYAEELRRYIQ